MSMNFLQSAAAIQTRHRKPVLLGALALLLGSFTASAQSSSRSQAFSAAYTPPATGSELGFSATGSGDYFSNIATTTAGSYGTYGVANGGNGVTGSSTALTFGTQIFQAGSTTNRLTFLIGSLTSATNTVGFGNNSSIVVNLSFATATATTSYAITILPPTSGADPTFLAGTAGSTTITSNGANQSVTMPDGGWSNITIDLGNFAVRTTVTPVFSLKTSRRNIIVVDNVTLSSSAPLPVELTKFAATTKASGIVLDWATASEKNSAAFEIQRSADGESFQTIAKVAALGNSVAAHSYTALDRTPLAGLSQYRLRQLDADGTVAYSPVVTARWAVGGETGVYPNPTKGTLFFGSLAAPARFRVLNGQGQALLAGNTSATGLDVQPLPAGIYLLEIVTESGRSVQRFVRE